MAKPNKGKKKGKKTIHRTPYKKGPKKLGNQIVNSESKLPKIPQKQKDEMNAYVASKAKSKKGKKKGKKGGGK